MSLSVVAIVGAANVGKSTLFNRLVGGRPAIVTSEPGATRDRLYAVVRTVPVPFRVVDTGGISGHGENPLAQGIDRQVSAALDEAAVVLLVVDVRVGATALDHEIAAMLRRRSLPILLVANKVDSPSQEAFTAEFFELGLGEPIPVSAEHGLGIDHLLTAVSSFLEPGDPAGGTDRDPEADRAVRVALVGRPNVGKSSLLNRLLGEERHLVTEIPGTTRDAVDTLLRREERTYVLVDTAGIRRHGRVRHETEALALHRARLAIRRADVAVLVLDASEGFAAQDAHIAGHAHEAARPLIVAVNKWDLLEDREEQARVWEQTLRERLRFSKEFPVLFVSARTNQRVAKILDRVDEVYAAGGIRVPTPELNRWLRGVAEAERSAPAAGRSVSILYATQSGVHPPRFVLFCNEPRRVHFSLRRHLENSLRDRFGFGPSPIHLQFRARRRRTGP